MGEINLVRCMQNACSSREYDFLAKNHSFRRNGDDVFPGPDLSFTYGLRRMVGHSDISFIVKLGVMDSTIDFASTDLSMIVYNYCLIKSNGVAALAVLGGRYMAAPRRTLKPLHKLLDHVSKEEITIFQFLSFDHFGLGIGRPYDVYVQPEVPTQGAMDRLMNQLSSTGWFDYFLHVGVHCLVSHYHSGGGRYLSALVHNPSICSHAVLVLGCYDHRYSFPYGGKVFLTKRGFPSISELVYAALVVYQTVVSLSVCVVFPRSDDDSILSPKFDEFSREIGGEECAVGFDTFSSSSIGYFRDSKRCSFFQKCVEHVSAEYLGHCTFGGSISPLAVVERENYIFEMDRMLFSYRTGVFEFGKFNIPQKIQIKEYDVKPLVIREGNHVCQLLLARNSGLVLGGAGHPFELFRLGKTEFTRHNIEPHTFNPVVLNFLPCEVERLDFQNKKYGGAVSFDSILNSIGTHGKTIAEDAVNLDLLIREKNPKSQADYNWLLRDYLDSFEKTGTPYTYRGEGWKSYFVGAVHTVEERRAFTVSILNLFPGKEVIPCDLVNNYEASLVPWELFVIDLRTYTTFSEEDVTISAGRPDLYRLYSTFYTCGPIPEFIKGFRVIHQRAGKLLNHFFRYRPRGGAFRTLINYQLMCNWYIYAVSDDYCCALACLVIKLGLFYIRGSVLDKVFTLIDNYVNKFASCPLLGYDLSGLGLANSLSILCPWRPMDGDNVSAFESQCKKIAGIVGLMNDPHLFRGGDLISNPAHFDDPKYQVWKYDLEHPIKTFDELPDYSEFNEWGDKFPDGVARTLGLCAKLVAWYKVGDVPGYDPRPFMVARNMGTPLSAKLGSSDMEDFCFDHIKVVTADAIPKVVKYIASKGNIANDEFYQSMWHTAGTTGSVIFGDKSLISGKGLSHFTKKSTFVTA